MHAGRAHTQLWDSRQVRKVSNLTGHREGLTGCAFTPGDRCVSVYAITGSFVLLSLGKLTL